jgi:hypothetical protein
LPADGNTKERARSDVVKAGVSFHLIPLQLGTEAQLLERALIALEPVESGETAFLPEYLAWTPGGSGQAFSALLAAARLRDINIVTTLNLGGELVTDLPGADPALRYNAVAIFTRHGVVHVPQAKVTPQSFEMDEALDGPGIGVTGYSRLNVLELDVDDELVRARFLVCSDVALLGRFTPAELACDLLIVMGNFAYGAEKHASRMLGLALAAGTAETALHINAFHVSDKRQPLANRVEEVLDATKVKKPARKWPKPRSLRSGFYIYPDKAAWDFVSMCHLKKRRGRIAVPESRAEADVTLGAYPITVNL